MTVRLESTVGARGQTVIPKPIRDQLHLRPGQKVWFRIEDNRIIIEREDPLALVESFLNAFEKRPLSEGELHALDEEQYEARLGKTLDRR